MTVKLVHARLPPLPTIRDIIRLYKLRAMRDLSQNFLLETKITDRIVAAAGKIKDGEVCEVGPGPGSITRSIIRKNPARIVVIEKDKRFEAPLEMLAEASPCPLDIIYGDVMNFKMDKMFSEVRKREWSEKPPDIHLIGNLPFNVATHLIIRWLNSIAERTNAWNYGRVPMTLTFQKEVAERMVAPIGSPQRCRLSVMCQNWCHVKHCFTIPGKAFVPKPEVDVGVVHFVPLESPVIDLPFQLIEKVVRCVFNFRQKYHVRGVAMLFPMATRDAYALEMCKLADLDPTLRPFQLTVEEMGRLCQAYNRILEKQPKLAFYNSRASRADRSKFDDEDDSDLLDLQISNALLMTTVKKDLQETI
ncbi:hypothetical protein LSTR_LSTR001089 [Laodelphax striatellus]|uniref:rRNA adenine N(6)-methyltransferase n=1 Tax=Laodelphax striatellus TaxID=195883 RepID=A0A482X218_LAOST|nr:hypothetical protein LSTR_LSTR001089 [Laodelphax striatellus]